jgi:glycosyltransferase involved in cell wall biosynthesis
MDQAVAESTRASYLAVMPNQSAGGLGVHTAQWARAMAAAGHNVTVLNLTKELRQRHLGQSNVKVVEYPLPVYGDSRQQYKVWSQALKEHKADYTVFCQGIVGEVQLAVMLALWRHSKRLIIIEHGMAEAFVSMKPGWKPPSPWKFWLLMRSTHRAIAISEAVKASAMRIYRVPSKWITTCPNWVDTDRCCPDGAVRQAHRTSLGIGDDEFIVGYAGRLSPEKRVVELLEGFALFAQQYPRRTRLIMVGQGGEKKKLEELIRQKQLESKVMLAGWTDDTLPWHRSFDMEANLTIGEGFGLSIVEAMACEVPVLVQTGGGVGEYLVHKHNGWLLNMPTAQDIANGIADIANASPEERKTIARTGRQTMLERYAPNVTLAQLLETLGSPHAAALTREHGLSLK